LAGSTEIYTDCQTGNYANAGYYAETCGSGAQVYYWDGNGSLSFSFTCP